MNSQSWQTRFGAPVVSPPRMGVQQTTLVLTLLHLYKVYGGTIGEPTMTVQTPEPLPTSCSKFMFKPVTTCHLPTQFVQSSGLVTKRLQCAVKCARDPYCGSMKVSPSGQSFECVNYRAPFPDGDCDPMSDYYNEVRPCLHGGVLRAGETTCTCFGGYVGNDCSEIMKDCTSGYHSGMYKQSGVYLVWPETALAPFQVSCRMSKSNGYTIIQRNTGAENFNRSWDEYAQGFGDISLDHWLGNTNIYHLTNQDTANTLKVTFETDASNGIAYYFEFNVADERDLFKMSFGWYEAEPGYELGLCFTSQNVNFNTFDNDPDSGNNCAAVRGGGWWFVNCAKCTANARVTGAPYSGVGDVNWQGLDEALSVSSTLLTLS